MSLAVAGVQTDFGLGECPGIAPHLIPENGAARMVNWLIDEDGSPYKRSGTSKLSASDFGTGGLTFLWDGWVSVGQRTVFANSSDFGVLGADGTSVVSIGGPGLAAPARAVEVGGILFIDGGYLYAGSRMTSAVTAGTVALTQGSATVTGTGTLWRNQIPAPDAGAILTVDNVPYVVEGVASDTSLTLTKPFKGATASGKTYRLEAVATAAGDVRKGPYVSVAQRLVSLEGNRAYFSAYGDPTAWNPAEDFHEITGGVQLLGGAALGFSAALFTTRGIWTIGNLEYEVVDDLGNPQQPESQEAQDLVLWSKEGIAGWQDALVVPATDGVWLIGPSTFEILTKSIAPLYTDYVQSGYRTGVGAVMQSHYVLPILKSDGSWVDTLVCRLDRPTRVRGQKMWPWTRWAGGGAQARAFVSRVGSTGSRSPLLLAAPVASTRVVRFEPFQHDSSGVDYDGSAVIPDLVSRDVQTGPLNENLVKKIEARYELIDLDTDPAEPKLLMYVGSDARPAEALWNSAQWNVDYWASDPTADTGFAMVDGLGPQSAGEKPFRWTVGRRMRYARYRITQEGASRRTVLRHTRVFVRPSGRI